jgi:hypothetical protein
VFIVKSEFKRYFFPGLFTILLLSFVMPSCDGDNGDAGIDSGTIPAVVFIADKDQAGVDELYASLDDGASVVKLSGTLVAGQNVVDFKISPDGSRVAYRADQDAPGVIELYVNSITGGTPVKVSGLNPVLVPGSNVEVEPLVTFDAFNWSPDSLLIAYIADQVTDEVFELFISAPDGSLNFRVSGTLTIIGDGGDVFDFEWAPDSSRIAFRADKDTNGIIELYTNRPLVTSTPIKVSGIFPAQGDVIALAGVDKDAFEWAPDSTRLAYMADQTNDNLFELFTALPSVAGAPIKVSADLSGTSKDVLEFKWAPNGSRIAYLADQDDNDVFELYTATPGGTDNDKVSVTPTDPDGDVWDFAWAPDSSRIAYRAEQDTNLVFELYTSPPDSNIGNAKLNPDTFVFGQNVTSFAWAPDSSLIAYLADQDTDNVVELYTSPPDSNIGNAKLNPDTFVFGQNVTSFAWTPDSSLIAYLADQDTDNVFELYSSTPDGSVTKVSFLPDPVLFPGRDVLNFTWAPDTSRIAYLADQDTDNVFELYTSPPDGSGNGKISGTIDPSGGVFVFEYEP